MKLSIRKLQTNQEELRTLALAYQRSYNKLSAAYKSPAEMALYTFDYFYQKVKRFAAENESSSESRTFVVAADDQPVGFVRYSKIPEYYKQNDNGVAQELEKGVLDKYEYAWYRKVKFVRDVKLDDSTMILNQIYLDPKVQRNGLGTYVLAKTLPTMKEHGVKNLILEYNADNHNAEKFYKYFGFAPLADTQDLDHIIKKNGRTNFCISNVKMVHVPVDTALEKAQIKIAQKTEASRQQQLGNILVRLVTHARSKNK